MHKGSLRCISHFVHPIKKEEAIVLHCIFCKLSLARLYRKGGDFDADCEAFAKTDSGNHRIWTLAIFRF